MGIVVVVVVVVVLVVAARVEARVYIEIVVIMFSVRVHHPFPHRSFCRRRKDGPTVTDCLGCHHELYSTRQKLYYQSPHGIKKAII